MCVTSSLQQGIQDKAIVDRCAALPPPSPPGQGRRQQGKQGTYICAHIHIDVYIYARHVCICSYADLCSSD